MNHVHRALSAALTGPDTAAVTLDLAQPHRWAVFSDQHKGARDGADEFRLCEPAYRAALEHYRDRGWTLVLLGDAEELWEQSFRVVEKAYPDTLRLEGSFPSGRSYRVWGNHDDAWMVPAEVRRKLGRYLTDPVVYEAVRLDVVRAGAELGTVLMLHGHQGRFASDRIRPLARMAVRFWRPIQRAFRVGITTPATDACYRARHDRNMYEWAAAQPRTILIAGHTHRPVWSSRTHLEKLQAELERRERAGEEGSEGVQALKRRIDDRRAKYPPCGETPKMRPCYFNTGCCKFADGDITGMEIEDGVVRLVKWSAQHAGGALERRTLEEESLATILERLTDPAPGQPTADLGGSHE